MATGKKTFIFYSDWINIIREMPDKEAGGLLKHILSYVNDENPTTENPFVRMAFGHMKPLIKQDLKKWEEIREKRKVAGSKGGKQKVANAKQVLSSTKQAVPVNDNVNVSTKVDLNINTPTEVEDSKIDFKILLEYINKKTKRGFRTINAETRRKYKARLKDGYKKEDISNAIINAVNTQYHKDNNYQYLTPEFFSRANTLDKYCNVSKIQTKDKVSPENWQSNPYNDEDN